MSKSMRIEIRCTDDEYKRWSKAASGLSLSSYIRGLLEVACGRHEVFEPSPERSRLKGDKAEVVAPDQGQDIIAKEVVAVVPSLVDEAGKLMCRRCVRVGNRSPRRLCVDCNPEK